MPFCGTCGLLQRGDGMNPKTLNVASHRRAGGTLHTPDNSPDTDISKPCAMISRTSRLTLRLPFSMSEMYPRSRPSFSPNCSCVHLRRCRSVRSLFPKRTAIFSAIRYASWRANSRSWYRQSSTLELYFLVSSFSTAPRLRIPFALVQKWGL